MRAPSIGGGGVHPRGQAFFATVSVLLYDTACMHKWDTHKDVHVHHNQYIPHPTHALHEMLIHVPIAAANLRTGGAFKVTGTESGPLPYEYMHEKEDEGAMCIAEYGFSSISGCWPGPKSMIGIRSDFAFEICTQIQPVSSPSNSNWKMEVVPSGTYYV